ncbi:Hydroxyacylglutathione hydrolase GloC [Myxococcaceae bacterium]|jgi:glyoxylase-like metal-dependent hydrolase (beta-lactamase superfamily II)|nr:Hydroxyacylglutathione hydrolase GloC [Myxococcaceae bacterium]
MTNDPKAPGLRRAPVAELPQVHQIVLPTPWEVGPVQIYLIEGDPITLVDTGVRSEPSRAALAAALDALGVGFEDVRRVVLTHHHGDHLGQAQSLRSAGADLEVLAHEAERELVENFSEDREEDIVATRALFTEHGVPGELLDRQAEMRRRWISEDPVLCEPTRVDRELRSGDRIGFKDFDLEVIHAPGHTAGHLLLHEPCSRTLFTGDHLMGDAVPFTETYYESGAPDPRDPLARRPRFRGLPAYMASLRELRGRSFRTILPAHGGIVERPSRCIEDAILFYEVRVQRIERALEKLSAECGATAWEIWCSLFPKADPVTQMRTRMLMVIGGLDVLEDAGRAVPERRADGVIAYRPR